MAIQIVLPGKAERLFREYRNADNVLTDPSNPLITVRGPSGGIVTDSASGVLSGKTPTKSTVGIYYQIHLYSTASAGVYAAWWEGTVETSPTTMDTPQYFEVRPMAWATNIRLVNAIRRKIGDTDPEDYKISIAELNYFIGDAVSEVEIDYPMGFQITLSPTSITFNKTLTSVAELLIIWKTVLLIMESILHGGLWETGSINVGDLSVSLGSGTQSKLSEVKRLADQYKELIYDLTMRGIRGIKIDTYDTNSDLDWNIVDYPFLSGA